MASQSSRKVWLITGASRGLGRSIAEKALGAGHLVIGTSRSGRADWGEGRAELQFLPLDLTKATEVEAFVGRAFEIHGRIDVLVNNAGGGLLGALEESTDEEVQPVFELNFFGPLRLIRAALPRLREQGSGHVVNISSIAGLAPGPGSSIYAAAKFALEGMSESMDQEVRPLGINVTIVEPGAFRTDFLSSKSIAHSSKKIEAYASTSGAMVGKLEAMDGNQIGDPDKGAEAILRLVDSDNPPLRLLLGSDAFNRAGTKLRKLDAEIKEWESVTVGTDYPASS